MQKVNPNSSESFYDLIKMFSYNKDLSLNIENKSIEHKNDIIIKDISYSGVSEKRIDAYLIKPSGEGPFPGIIFVHPAPGSRDTFLDEAINLAEIGAMSLLVDAPWAHTEFVAKILELFQNGLREWYIQILIDLRRGIDILTLESNLDLNRLGYVGHSFGALFGGILAGVDERIKSHILMSGTGNFVDVAAANIPDITPDIIEKHKNMMNIIDPIHYISHTTSNLFFQFGLQDTVFSKQNQINYYYAANEPKSIRWYDAGHYLNDEARSDRIDWLSTQLKL